MLARERGVGRAVYVSGEAYWALKVMHIHTGESRYDLTNRAVLEMVSRWQEEQPGSIVTKFNKMMTDLLFFEDESSFADEEGGE